MKYGYARVSKDEKDPALQLAALEEQGCSALRISPRFLLLRGSSCRLLPWDRSSARGKIRGLERSVEQL
jgi:hypothetical protein